MSSPIAVLDAELTHPLPVLLGLQGYASAQVLVRVRGVPLGEVTIPLERGCAHPETLPRAIVQKLGCAIARAAMHDAMTHGVGGDVPDLDRWLDASPSDEEQGCPLVTVAVCTRDRPDDLARCLDALRRVDYPRLDLLVVDNAPASDATERVMAERYPEVRYVREVRPGLDWARNRAIAECRGEILAYTDDDVIVDRGWVRAMANAFALDPTIAAVTGLVLPYELETDAQQYFEAYGGFGRGFVRRWYRPPGGVVAPLHAGSGKFGTGANMAFRRAIFDRIGGFDPALDVGTVTCGGGDLEMFYRVLKQGHTLLYEPAALVRHRHRREYAALHRQITCNGIGFYSHLVRSAKAFPDERAALARFGAWWFGVWSLKRLARSFVCRMDIPRDLIWAELKGSLQGLGRYGRARAAAEAIAAEHGTGPVAAHPAAEPGSRVAPTADTAIRQVDIAGRVQPITDVGRYRHVRLLVTSRDSPLGIVNIDNEGFPVSAAQLRDAISAALSAELVEAEDGPAVGWSRLLTTLASRLIPPRQRAAPPQPSLPREVAASVVIATRNRPDALRDCLASLAAQQTMRRLEIIVVDNDPASGLTPPVVREFDGVRLVNEARPGLSYARNAGILAATSPIIVATDDDVTCPPGWIETLLVPFVDPSVMIVTGNVLPKELDARAQVLFEQYGGLSRGFRRRRVDAAWFRAFRRAVPTWTLGATANAAFRTSIFEDPRIGLMDEALGAGTPTGCSEDTYVFYRVLKNGGAIVYTPDAYVWHRHRQTMRTLRRQIFSYAKGHVAYHLTTWLRDGDRRGLLRVVAELPDSFARRIYHRLRGWNEYPIRMILIEVAGTLAGPWALWRARRRVRRLGRSAENGIRPTADAPAPERAEGRDALFMEASAAQESAR